MGRSTIHFQDFENSDFQKNKIKEYSNLTIINDEVVDFNVNNNKLSSVLLRRLGDIKAAALIVCSGTFLHGKIHQSK